jgi:hypothetical protein
VWIWAALVLQFLGYVFDAAWHGLVSPGAEPATTGEMMRHLATVHLPLYVGTAAVLISTFIALLQTTRRSQAGIALPVAFTGAVLAAGAEAWHAWSHLHLDTHSAPVAGMLSVVGFVVVVTAMTLSGRSQKRRAAGTTGTRAA